MKKFLSLVTEWGRQMNEENIFSLSLEPAGNFVPKINRYSRVYIAGRLFDSSTHFWNFPNNLTFNRLCPLSMNGTRTELSIHLRWEGCDRCSGVYLTCPTFPDFCHFPFEWNQVLRSRMWLVSGIIRLFFFSLPLPLIHLASPTRQLRHNGN
jgi:hypothetical protein